MNDNINPGLAINDRIVAAMHTETSAHVTLRSYQELLPGERNRVTDCIEDNELDVPRFFEFNGVLMDLFAFENTSDDNVYLYDHPTPGSWMGEYSLIKAALTPDQKHATIFAGHTHTLPDDLRAYYQ